MTEYSPTKTGEYPRIFPNFQICARCEKDLKDNKDNSRHLGRKYARIFLLGYYLFLVALSFPRASLSENCSLLGTDNVRGQISEHIFAPNGDYCLYIPVGHHIKTIYRNVSHSFPTVCLSLAKGSDQVFLNDTIRLPAETHRNSLLLLCYSQVFSEQFHLDEKSTPAGAG